jgi:hypothetical protein
MLGLGPRTPTVIRSLRCEIVTFFVENKLRSQLWARATARLKMERTSKRESYYEDINTLRQFPFIDIDSKQYASLQADTKNIDSYTASLGVDWKYVGTPMTNFTSYHIGPAYSQTRTFEGIQPIAVPQDADLGSSKSFIEPGDPPTPKAASYTTLYNQHPREDEAFYCYKSFVGSTASSLKDAINDVQQLLVHAPAYEQFVNFQRIYVDGITLANWLQNRAADMSENYRTFQDSPENVLPGQFEYAFTLDVKPSLDLKYTFAQNAITPLIPELSGNLEHSGTFTLYLNTPYALASLQAKNGNSCIGEVVMGVCKPKRVPTSILH